MNKLLLVLIILLVIIVIYHFRREITRLFYRYDKRVEGFSQGVRGGGMPSTTLTLIGKTPQKPKRGFVLEDAKHFKGNWNNYALSFTIKPITTGSGWRSIIHNTMTGANCCNNYERWPGIWFYSNTTRLHIRYQRNQGLNPEYRLPLNKISRVTCIVDGATVRVVIRDENDEIKYNKTTKLSQHSPPNSDWGLPLKDYGGSMQYLSKTGRSKLAEGEGDCDRDSDCQSGLRCYQRGSSDSLVPGIRRGYGGGHPHPVGGENATHDYCYKPGKGNRQAFYMSDPWYNAVNCEISELILDTNTTCPTYKFLTAPKPKPTQPNAFYFVCDKKTFMEHHSAALAMGGHLASIHSKADNDAIVKVLPPNTQHVFIGAIRKRPGSGDSAQKWTWTDGSNWDYANWRGGEPNDCCKSSTGNMGEIYGEIRKSDGKWNDIMHKHNSSVKRFPAVYKLNATYENSWPAGIVRLNTDGMNSWAASKKLCEGEANSGNVIGAHGTIASRREVLDYIKGKPESGDSWTPVSDGDNVWLQVGMRNDRGGLTPSFAMTHQEIPDVAYTKSGEAGKPSWGITNTKRTYRKSLFCKKPPEGMTWDNASQKFVKAKLPDQTSSTGSLLPSAITTQKHSSGEKILAVGNDHKFKPGQTIIIGVPPNTETRTIVKA